MATPADQRTPNLPDLDATGRLIIDSARAVLGEEGLAAMTVQAVAARAGVTRGSVAFRFGRWSDLLVAVAEDVFERSLAAIDGYFKTHPSDEPNLVEAIAEMASQPAAAPFMALFAEVSRPNSPIIDAYGRFYEGLRRRIVDRLDATAPWVADTEKLAVLVVGATIGINFQHWVSRGGLDRRGAFAYLRETVDLATAPM